MRGLILGGLMAAAAAGSPVAPPATPAPPASWSDKVEDFPADVPVYLPASEKWAKVSRDVATLGESTVDSPEKVARFYQEMARKRGWSADPKVITRRVDGRVLLFHKGDRVLRVDAFQDPGEGNTAVFLVVGLPPPASPSPSPKASPSR